MFNQNTPGHGSGRAPNRKDREKQKMLGAIKDFREAVVTTGGDQNITRHIAAPGGDASLAYKPDTETVSIAVRPNDLSRSVAATMADTIASELGRTPGDLTEKDAGAAAEYVTEVEWKPSELTD